MKMPRYVAALALSAVVFTDAVLAQPPGNYAGLVRLYASGRGADAVAALLRWPHGEAIGAAKAAATMLTPAEMIPAAVLHTEAALGLVDARPFDATAHIEAAQALLRTAARDASQRERADAVAVRWYYFAANLLTSANQMEQASWYIREGLVAFPRNAPLYFARGAIAEVSVQFEGWRGLRRNLPENTRERTRIESLLKRAVDDYQRALSIDAHFALAHLRIGWIRLFLDDNRARRELEAAAADAPNDRVRYLAHLMLGGAAERERRLDDAKREYEAAVATGAGFQSGYLALSRVEEAMGASAHARELAMQCAQLQKDDPDPWWDFAMNFDRGMLNDLRAEARRP